MEYSSQESKVILVKFEPHVHTYIDADKCEAAGKPLPGRVLARWQPQIRKEPKPKSSSKGCECGLVTSAVCAGNQGVNEHVLHPRPGLGQPGGNIA